MRKQRFKRSRGLLIKNGKSGEGEGVNMKAMMTRKEARLSLQAAFERYRECGEDVLPLTRSDIAADYKFLSEVCYLAVMSYRRNRPELVSEFEAYLTRKDMSVADFKRYEEDFMASPD